MVWLRVQPVVWNQSISSMPFDDHRDIFTAFGGHAGAAGMTLPRKILVNSQIFYCNYVYDNDIDTSAKNTLNLDEAPTQ